MSKEKTLKLNKSRAIQHKNLQDVKNCCEDLGNFFRKIGRFDEAFLEYSEIAELCCEKDPIGAATAWRFMGEVLIAKEDFDDGFKYIKRYHAKVLALDNRV